MQCSHQQCLRSETGQGWHTHPPSGPGVHPPSLHRRRKWHAAKAPVSDTRCLWLTRARIRDRDADADTHTAGQPIPARPLVSGRRGFVLNSSLAVLLLVGTDDPTTILNAVLSGYGLPTLKGSDALKEYDEFENEWYFSYPKAWVARPNSQRSGFYVSNFQTADKATVESFPVPEGDGPEADKELIRRAVAAAVVPGTDQADDKLTRPADRLIKTEEKVIDGKRYIYMAFPSETLTRSGYNIKRKHFAVVAVKRGTAYTLSASARSDQYNKDKAALLQQIVESFRVR